MIRSCGEPDIWMGYPAFAFVYLSIAESRKLEIGEAKCVPLYGRPLYLDQRARAHRILLQK